jgi:MoaA/NifB/PqqE/SkfB family radical SAM enzyme
MELSILYRGPLESCNYGCDYCPFAKKKDSRADLRRDERALERFVSWVGTRRSDRIGVFVTPWGEALVRRHYRDALVALSRMPNVTRAAIQTNLSCDVSFAEDADKAKLALWATYHPEWVSRPVFVEKVRSLHAMGARISVGAVGFVRFAAEVEALRRELPDGVYLWINAVKKERYAETDVARFAAIDPLFSLGLTPHPSRGRACRAGETVVSVDGDGDVRRCHFIRDVIANLYEPGLEDALVPRPCTNETCGCHIGYVHMDELGLYDVFGAGVLERVPASPVWRGRRLSVVHSSIARTSHS